MPYKVSLKDQGNSICGDDGCDSGLLETSANLFGIPRLAENSPFVLRVDARDNNCFGIYGSKTYALNVNERDGDVDRDGRELVGDLVSGENVSSYLFVVNHRGEVNASSSKVSYGRLPSGLSLRKKTPSCSEERFDTDPTNCVRGGIQIIGKTSEVGKRYFNVLFKFTDGTQEERTYVVTVSRPTEEPLVDE